MFKQWSEQQELEDALLLEKKFLKVFSNAFFEGKIKRFPRFGLHYTNPGFTAYVFKVEKNIFKKFIDKVFH